MAPNLSGIAAADAARSLLLNELAHEFCLEHLKPNGVFVTKSFQGSGFSQFVEALKKTFKKVYTAQARRLPRHVGRSLPRSPASSSPASSPCGRNNRSRFFGSPHK